MSTDLQGSAALVRRIAQMGDPTSIPLLYRKRSSGSRYGLIGEFLRLYLSVSELLSDLVDTLKNKSSDCARIGG